MSIENYKDPIVSQWYTEDGQKVSIPVHNEINVVVGGMFALTGLPDIFNRVQIDGMVEIDIKDKINTANQFKVDYTNGYVYVHSDREGEIITVTQYYSRGVSYYPSSRVYTKLTETGDVSETLKDIEEKIGKSLELSRLIQEEEDIRISNEIIRRENEDARLVDEENRRLAESERATNETDRLNNEDARETNESQRVANENNRTSQEDGRIAAENQRKLSETSRESAEVSRSENESIREINETNRQSNEQTRETNENLRTSNENLRESAELERKNNEDARISNENTRESNEDIRQVNENARNIKEQERVESEIIRVQNEIAREDNEDRRIALEDELIVLKGQLEGLRDHLSEGNFGDMFKVIYDADNDGKVDMANDSERLGGQLPSYYAKQSDLDDKVDNSRVLTDVPKNAKFTDTVTPINDTLISTSTTEALSANQGRTLDNKIDILKGSGDLKEKSNKEDLVATQNDLENHKQKSIHENEVHGLRIKDGKLEYWDVEEEKWKQIAGGGGSQVSLGNIENFTATPDDGKVILSWKDPEDIVVDGIVISKWKGTKILRKTGSYPANENDGVLVVDSGIRNQYEIGGFEDMGLQNDTEYFYMAFPYTADGLYTSDIANRASAIPTAQKIYGVEVDEGNSNPATRITYTDDAVGMTPMRGNNGMLDYGSWEDVIKNDFGINSVVLKNMEVNYYLNNENRTQKADGTPSILTGADGDVMTELGNKLYYKWTVNGNIHHKQISSRPFEGAVSYAFEVEEGYNLVPFETLKLLQILYEILFCHHDSQTALGRGRVDGAEGYANTGGTNTKGMTYGSEADEQMSFLGIEDFWGNKLWWIDGLVTDGNYNILIGNSNFNDAGNGYISYSSGISAGTNGYMDKVQGGINKGFILKSASGSGTTHYADYANLNSGRVAVFGGFRSVGSYAGAFALRLNYSASNASASVGARLFCAKNGKLYVGAYLGTTVGGKLRSISGSTPSDSKTIGAFRAEARANNN